MRCGSSRPPTKKSEVRKPSTAATVTNLNPAWIPVANDCETYAWTLSWAEAESWLNAAARPGAEIYAERAR